MKQTPNDLASFMDESTSQLSLKKLLFVADDHTKTHNWSVYREYKTSEHSFLSRSSKSNPFSQGSVIIEVDGT